MTETNTTTRAIETASDKLRLLAAEVRANPYAREAIASGFELMADQLEPCQDCASQAQAGDAVAGVIAHDDNPATGGGTTAIEAQPGII